MTLRSQAKQLRRKPLAPTLSLAYQGEGETAELLLSTY